MRSVSSASGVDGLDLDDLFRKSQQPHTGKAVFHYTDGAGLIGILERRVLWASTADSMNDEKEIETGFALIQDELLGDRGLRRYREHLDALSDAREMHSEGSTYIVSASTDGDSLSMWRGYGGAGEVSYAIGLRPEAGYRVVKRTPGNMLQPVSRPRLPEAIARQLSLVPVGDWLRVSYDHAATLARLRNILTVLDQYSPPPGNPIVGTVAASLFMNIASTVKPQGFKDENEVRLVIQPSPGVEVIRFRPGRFSITNFIELTAKPTTSASHSENGEGEAYAGPTSTNDWGKTINEDEPRPLLPISEIRVGPTRYPNQAIRSIRRLLVENGYQGVAVTSSTIPFR